MNCSILSALDFTILSLIYGSAFAAVAEGMKYFSPCGIIFYRMLFGFLTAIVVCVIRILTNKDYWQIFKAHFVSGIPHILWICVSGLLFHGLPHCLTAIGQQWVSSASVQVAQPLATAFGALLSNFVLPDEPFNWIKGLVLVLSLTGVALSSIPSFMGAGVGNGTVGQTALGYFLVVTSVAFFGFAAVVMKWKTPNTDVSAAALIQTCASAIVTFIIELIWDGPKELYRQSHEAPAIAWLWPFLVGFLGTGLAATGYNYLVSCWGAAGANLIPFGQIVVGVVIGVSFLHEWDKYKVWQIVVSAIGIILLIIAIILGFYDKPKTDETAKQEEEEDVLEDAPTTPGVTEL